MLMLYDNSDVYMHADLVLWILRPDLGQPSKISDRGKNVRASLNGPNCGRGQCSQSTIGAERDGLLCFRIGNTLAAKVPV
jgi:hypothetical protein